MVLLLPSSIAGRIAPNNRTRRTVGSTASGSQTHLDTKPHESAWLPSLDEPASASLPEGVEALVATLEAQILPDEAEPAPQSEYAEAPATYSASVYASAAGAGQRLNHMPTGFRPGQSWMPPESSLRLRDRSV